MPLKNNAESNRAWRERTQQKLRENPPPRVPLPRVSKRQAKRNKEYSAARAIKLEQQPFCERCLRDGAQVLATDIHHLAGRDGERMIDSENMISLCRYCHEAIHNNPAESMALGWMRSRHRSSNQ